MTALLKDKMRRQRRISHDLRPLAAGTKAIKGGAAMCITQGTSQGYYAEASSLLTGVVVGFFDEDVDNTLGTDGALSANVEFALERTVELLANDAGTPVTIQMREQLCYILDDQTATGATNGAVLGVVYDVDSSNRVHVEVDCVPAALKAAQVATAGPYKARNLVTSLAAYGGSGTGTLTETGSGAWATQDGVTNAVGDVVFIQATTTNLTSANDSGPWVIANLGSASTSWVLQRPSWWQSGTPIQGGTDVILQSGTANAGQTYRSFGSGNVGAADPSFYPRLQTVTTAAMTAGVSAANSTLFVRPNAEFSPIPVTPGGTQGILRMSTSTSGYPGTSSLVVTSSSGTDTSTVKIQVVNF